MAYNNSFGNNRRKRGNKGGFIILIIILAVIIFGAFMIERSSDVPKVQMLIPMEISIK